ncbi:MAG: ribulose-phosphate 3-epimerase [Planctomycetaceae bacterium]|jgi:ribulose-phosphate 3-epimerase|nr:ribulose-phosphate 3-epimerase [Planctomycetaceae bacterium]
MLPPKIAASMMCADFLHLEKDVAELEKSGADFLHFDIMDGVFVPNLMLCNEMMKGLRKATTIPYDVHLMIVHPEQKIKWFDLQPDDVVSVHYESTPHIHRAIQEIKNAGAKPAIALNPATPVGCIEHVLPDVEMVLLMTVNPGFAGQKLIEQTLDKIRATRDFLDQRGYENVMLQVDGNCSFANIPRMRASGADCFVAGSSSVFAKGTTITEACRQLREVMK